MKKLIYIILAICSFVLTACDMPASADGGYTFTAVYKGESLEIPEESISKIVETAEASLGSSHLLNLALSKNSINEFKDNGLCLEIKYSEEKVIENEDSKYKITTDSILILIGEYSAYVSPSDGGAYYLSGADEILTLLEIEEQPEESAGGNYADSAFYMGEKILLTEEHITEISETAKNSLDSKYELKLALSADNVRDYKENGCYISINYPEEREFKVKGYENSVSDSSISIYISDELDSVVSVSSHYFSLKRSACKAILSIAQSAEVIPDNRYISSVTYKNIIFDLNAEGSKAILNLIDDSLIFNLSLDLELMDSQIESYRENGLYISVVNPDMEDTLVLIDNESAYIRYDSNYYTTGRVDFLNCLGLEPFPTDNNP